MQSIKRDQPSPAPNTAMLRGPRPESARRKYGNNRDQQQQGGNSYSNRDNNYVEKNSAFPMLSAYTCIDHLLNDTMALLEKGVTPEGGGGVRPVDAVNMMNRLKQMARDERSRSAEDGKRLQRAMVLCAEAATTGIRHMHSKHVALALNAIKDRNPPLFAQDGSEALLADGIFQNLFKEATARALHLLELDADRSSEDRSIYTSIPAQTLAIILNSVTAAGQDMVPLFQRASVHLQGMGENSADAHSIASILNAYAGMDMWDAALYRSMSARVVRIPRESFTLQSVGMVLNSYSRFLERTCTWDVTESDLHLFQALALVTRWLCSRTSLRSAGTVRSLTLIVNAFAKVGIPDPELLTDVAALFESVPQAFTKTPTGLFDSQSVANLMNAYAKMDCLTPSLFALLSAEAKALPQASLQGQHISNILNAAVKAGHHDKELFVYMSTVLQRRRTLQSLTPQSIALVLNAYARGECWSLLCTACVVRVHVCVCCVRT
jgi:hypothetical protein